FGIFDVDPSRPMHSLAEAYGVAPPAGSNAISIADFIALRVGGKAEVGDRVGLDTLELVVREVDEKGRPIAVGLALSEDSRSDFSPSGFWAKMLGRLRPG